MTAFLKFCTWILGLLLILFIAIVVISPRAPEKPDPESKSAVLSSPAPSKATAQPMVMPQNVRCHDESGAGATSGPAPLRVCVDLDSIANLPELGPSVMQFTLFSQITDPAMRGVTPSIAADGSLPAERLKIDCSDQARVLAPKIYVNGRWLESEDHTSPSWRAIYAAVCQPSGTEAVNQATATSRESGKYHSPTTRHDWGHSFFCGSGGCASDSEIMEICAQIAAESPAAQYHAEHAEQCDAIMDKPSVLCERTKHNCDDSKGAYGWTDQQ